MTLIARRIKAAREAAGLTQRQLSDQLGFKDRQTVAAIEAGNRKVSAQELIQIMRVLERDLDYFTDPFRLDGESSFLWRASEGADERLAEFELRASRWLALYRTLVRERHDTSWWSSPIALSLTARSSYEDAHRAAEWIASDWKLGDVPAATLETAIRERLQTLVLHVDAPEGVSGAAFKLPEINAILVNRNEPEGRRNFDLAHELFHLLTWETIKPAHTEWGMLNPKGRPEQLANCFASALLMPEKTVRSWMGDGDHVVPRLPVSHAETWREWLNDRAYSLRVSTPALQWRMVQIGLLDKKNVDPALDWFEDANRPQATQKPFSPEYVRVLHDALSAGKLSVRRAAGVLDMSVDELAALFTQYQLDVPFDI